MTTPDAEPGPGPDAQGASVPYEDEDRFAYEWTRRAAELQDAGRIVARASVVRDVLGTVVTGPCPRCGHHLVDHQVGAAAFEEAFLGDDVEAAAAAIDVERVVVTCGCERDHEGRPTNAVPAGCGISFAVLAEVEER